MDEAQDGQEKLWCYFGCNRASWLTIPRVLLHEMPDAWQGKLADLLEEYDRQFPNQPDFGTTVRLTDMQGKLIKTPEWVINYRHPNRSEIEQLKPIDEQFKSVEP